MPVSITLTIPDEHAARAKAALAVLYPQLGPKQAVIQLVRNAVRLVERRQAAEAVQAAAEAVTDIDIA